MTSILFPRAANLTDLANAFVEELTAEEATLATQPQTQAPAPATPEIAPRTRPDALRSGAQERALASEALYRTLLGAMQKGLSLGAASSTSNAPAPATSQPTRLANIQAQIDELSKQQWSPEWQKQADLLGKQKADALLSDPSSGWYRDPEGTLRQASPEMAGKTAPNMGAGHALAHYDENGRIEGFSYVEGEWDGGKHSKYASDYGPDTSGVQRAAFNSDGTVKTPGYTPGGDWVGGGEPTGPKPAPPQFKVDRWGVRVPDTSKIDSSGNWKA